jgi:hypothetical protein
MTSLKVEVVLQDAYMNLGIAFQSKGDDEKKIEEVESTFTPETPLDQSTELSEINKILKEIKNKIIVTQGEINELQEQNLLKISDHCEDLLEE